MNDSPSPTPPAPHGNESLDDSIDDDSNSSSPNGLHAHRVKSDKPFYAGLIILGGSYLLLIVLMLLADATYSAPLPSNFGTSEAIALFPFVPANIMVGSEIPKSFLDHLDSREIQFSIWLSMISCTITTVLSLWVAIPIGYLMSRYEFRGKNFIDAMLDIPIVLPPLVVGISLLVLFRILGDIEFGDTHPLRWLRDIVVFELPAVILAQFMVACAFAVRTMRATFDQIPPRREQVALTLGCTRSQAFFSVVLPDAKRGVVAAATLAWARSLGEFGPILVFAGATPLRTEVLPTSVFLRMQAGDLNAALAVSLVMVILAVGVLVLTRMLGLGKLAF